MVRCCWLQFIKLSCEKKKHEEIRYPDSKDQTYPKNLNAPKPTGSRLTIALFSLLSSVRLKGLKKKGGEGWKKKNPQSSKRQLQWPISAPLRKQRQDCLKFEMSLKTKQIPDQSELYNKSLSRKNKWGV